MRKICPKCFIISEDGEDKHADWCPNKLQIIEDLFGDIFKEK